MTIAVDTSILIDHLRGDPRPREVLGRAIEERERLVASVLTRIEILAGMRTGEEAVTYQLFDLFDWVPVDQALAEHAGDLARQFLRSHPGIDLVDFAIAATAERFDADLWTRNTKHFPMLERARNPY